MKDETRDLELKRAGNAAMASLLNLTLLPVVSFIYLLLLYRKTQSEAIDRYHATVGIKVNLIAAAALLFVSGFMIAVGGFDSAWTWVYVISYFTMVHTFFIVFAIWVLVRAWSGDRLKKSWSVSKR